MEKMRNAYNILVGKPEGKRPRGRLGEWSGSRPGRFIPGERTPVPIG